MKVLVEYKYQILYWSQILNIYLNWYFTINFLTMEVIQLKWQLNQILLFKMISILFSHGNKIK